MIFSKKKFWDVDVRDLNKIQHARFIISRIASYGNSEDWQSLLQEYGAETVKNELIQTRYLDTITLDFCSRYFNIPKEQFRCYTLTRSNQLHWKY